MGTVPQPVVLLIADISGYTRFMLANQTAAVHGQMVITKLLEAIISEAEIPLEVNQVEGDAVFLYAIKPDDEAEWQQVRQLIGRKLISFFEAFARGILVGSEFALCHCPSCQNVESLKLKIVVHSGQAVFHQVGRFSELSGVDVILVHRLLKNTVDGNEYVLMTEAAYRDIEFPKSVDVVRGQESYDGFGDVVTYTYTPSIGSTPRPEAVESLYADRNVALRQGLRTLGRGYFGQLSVLTGTGSSRRHRRKDELPLSPASRAWMVLKILVQTPVALPLGAAIAVYRALTRSTRASRKLRP